MTTPTRTPARAGVEAFGDCAALAALYRDDVTWRLNRSLAPNIAGPHVGRAAVCGFNEAVFTKFFRGDHAGVAGAGLGLAICRGIAEAHGGSIQVRRRAGAGAVFCVTLPTGGEPPSLPGGEEAALAPLVEPGVGASPPAGRADA